RPRAPVLRRGPVRRAAGGQVPAAAGGGVRRRTGLPVAHRRGEPLPAFGRVLPAHSGGRGNPVRAGSGPAAARPGRRAFLWPAEAAGRGGRPPAPPSVAPAGRAFGRARL